MNISKEMKPLIKWLAKGCADKRDLRKELQYIASDGDYLIASNSHILFFVRYMMPKGLYCPKTLEYKGESNILANSWKRAACFDSIKQVSKDVSLIFSRTSHPGYRVTFGEDSVEHCVDKKYLDTALKIKNKRAVVMGCSQAVHVRFEGEDIGCTISPGALY